MCFYPKYTYTLKGVQVSDALTLLTGDIKLTGYGIPMVPKNGMESFYKSEAERAFIRLPLDSTQPACVDLEKCMSAIDEIMLSDNITSQIENKRAPVAKKGKSKPKACDYSPCCKESTSTSEKAPQFGSTKVKFDVDFNTSAMRTKVFVKNAANKNELMPTAELTDIEKYIRYGCTLRMGIVLQKIWIKRNFEGYGVTFKCVQVVVKNQAKSNTMKFDTLLFADEGDVEENVAPQVAPVSARVSAPVSAPVSAQVSVPRIKADQVSSDERISKSIAPQASLKYSRDVKEKSRESKDDSEAETDDTADEDANESDD
jgi:hypothetical protein